MKEPFVGLAWAAGIVLLSLGAKMAFEQGYIDRETMLRTAAMSGLAIVYYGNRLPKIVAPGIAARQVARVAGWSQVLSGLIYAGLWIFAPISVAKTVGSAAVVAGVLVTLGNIFWIGSRTRAGKYSDNT